MKDIDVAVIIYSRNMFLLSITTHRSLHNFEDMHAMFHNILCLFESITNVNYVMLMNERDSTSNYALILLLPVKTPMFRPSCSTPNPAK
jgi:hypothetical protein